MIVLFVRMVAVGAAFVQQIIRQGAHFVICRANADDPAAIANLLHKSRRGEELHMMGKCRTGDPGPGPKVANRQTLWPRAHKNLQHIQPLLGTECGKCRSGFRQTKTNIRIVFHISIFLEMSNYCQAQTMDDSGNTR